VTQRREHGEPWSRRASALLRALSCAGIGLVTGLAAAAVFPWQVATLLAWDVTALLFCV